MREYYITEFKWIKEKYFCIWFSNERDGFISSGNHIRRFSSIEMLKLYCEEKNIILARGVTRYNFNEVNDWVENLSCSINCSTLLNIWNITTDIANSVDLYFYGKEEKLTDIYNRLFLGNNLPSIRNSKEIYTPIWTKEESVEINKLLKNSISIVENSIFYTSDF